MKMTKKEIQNGYNKVYCVGYCELQYLLRRLNRVGYNSGVPLDIKGLLSSACP